MPIRSILQKTLLIDAIKIETPWAARASITIRSVAS